MGTKAMIERKELSKLTAKEWQAEKDALDGKMPEMKRRIPTKEQWLILRNILGNGWGDGDYLEMVPHQKRQAIQAMRAFEEWLESRYQIKFVNPLL